ncbi:MAG: pyruvoyl-dependent arginine decarboxylase [Candidatus Aenigmatarchaeota archaeon]
MEIRITSGTGEAGTRKGAFDKALYETGLANYNLVELSSIIPEGARIRRKNMETDEERYGDKAYVVLSKSVATEQGREAWASLGWHYHTEDQKGVFVEYDGETEDEVTRKIEDAVNTLHQERRNSEAELHMEKKGIECDGNPVCAIVAAVYDIERWD